MYTRPTGKIWTLIILQVEQLTAFCEEKCVFDSYILFKILGLHFFLNTTPRNKWRQRVGKDNTKKLYSSDRVRIFRAFHLELIVYHSENSTPWDLILKQLVIDMIPPSNITSFSLSLTHMTFDLDPSVKQTDSYWCIGAHSAGCTGGLKIVNVFCSHFLFLHLQV